MHRFTSTQILQTFTIMWTTHEQKDYKRSQ